MTHFVNCTNIYNSENTKLLSFVTLVNKVEAVQTVWCSSVRERASFVLFCNNIVLPSLTLSSKQYYSNKIFDVIFCSSIFAITIIKKP